MAKRVLLIFLAVGVVAPRDARAADPTTAECLSAAESSLALRHKHKLRDARAKLLVCSANSCPADVRTECVRRVAEVNVAIPTVVLDAKDASGNDLVAVSVTLDGQPLTDSLDGAAISLDPGPHLFTFETAGQPKVSKQLLIREGEKDRRETVTFAAAAVKEPVPALSLPAISSAPPPADGGWSARKTAGVGFGVGALAGLATGVVYGFVYDSRARAFNDAGCGTSALGTDQNPDGCSARHDSVENAKYILIAGYAAAALLGGVATYLLLSTPSEAPSTAGRTDPAFAWRCLPAGPGVACGARF